MPEEDLEKTALETAKPPASLQLVLPVYTGHVASCLAWGWRRSRETACRHWTTPSSLLGFLPPSRHGHDVAAARSRLQASLRLRASRRRIGPGLEGIFSPERLLRAEGQPTGGPFHPAVRPLAASRLKVGMLSPR